MKITYTLELFAPESETWITRQFDDETEARDTRDLAKQAGYVPLLYANNCYPILT